MSNAIAAMDSADEIIDRLARQWAADALGEVQFLETLGIPERLGSHLAIAGLHRASVKLQARLDRKDG